MIDLTIQRDRDAVASICCKGHAGYADPGEDIVCSAVSALMQTAAIALLAREGAVVIEEDPAYAQVSLRREMSRQQRAEAAIVLGAIADGLRSIHMGYPNYITLREV